MGARNYLAILGVTPGMSRMHQMANPDTLGPMFHTPTQAMMRQSGLGRDGADAWAADQSKRGPDGGSPADANVCRLTRHPDGSADSVRLEATGDGWVDLGGATPRDVKVVNW